MIKGTPINRQWVGMLRDGTPVIDWGDGKAQDIYTGDFRDFEEREFSHGITNKELDQLIKAGRVAEYDAKVVYVHVLPEIPRQVLD